MKESLKTFLKQAISKDERGVSILVIIGLFFTVASGYMLYRDGNIPSGLVYVDIWLYGFIAANSATYIVENFKKIKE